MASDYEDYEDYEGDERPGAVTKVEVEVPTPTLEQVAMHMARQVLNGERYSSERPSLRALAESKLDELIASKIEARATAIVEDLLTKPIQCTDTFGQPTGEPVSLHAIMAKEIDSWCTVSVDSSGREDRNSYGTRTTRLEWLVKQVTSTELQSAVTKEVDRIKAELKAAATGAIAKQIAERVAGMVLK